MICESNKALALDGKAREAIKHIVSGHRPKAARSACAAMVSAGLTAAEEGKKEASMTKRLR